MRVFVGGFCEAKVFVELFSCEGRADDTAEAVGEEAQANSVEMLVWT